MNMADRKKVIKGLEICRHRVISQENCMECPYIYDGRSKQSNCEGVLHWDALALLKEQDAIKPFSDDDGAYWCGSCHEDMVWHQKFCSNCGKPVLWERR